MSQLISAHNPCPDCGSRDALAVYDHGIKCFSCGYYRRIKDRDELLTYVKRRGYSVSDFARQNNTVEVQDNGNQLALEEGYYAIPERNINEDTVRRYGVIVSRDKDSNNPFRHMYPYYTQEGNMAQKFRDVQNKKFWSGGLSSKCQMFGQHLFAKGSAPAVTIVEGELDALAAFQMNGSKYPVVAVPGAENAAAFIKTNLEWLESFETVVLCLDNDEPGVEATKKCCSLFSPKKVKMFKHLDGFKDACDYLKAGQAQLFINQWFRSEPWTPDGIVASSTLLDRIKQKKNVESLPYPFPTLQSMTYGIRKKETVVFVAPTNVGKTQVLREIEYHILQTDKTARIGALFLEESVEDSGLGVMSLYANKPLHLPDTEYTDEELESAHKAVLGDDRVYFYDSSGITQIESIINKIRYYAKALDCGYIFIDNFSILTSDHSQGDERKRLDESITKLRNLALELNIAIIAVAHLNREGAIRGSTSIENFSNIIVGLERDIKNPDPTVRNTMVLTVWKNRFSGRTGPAGYLRYNATTGRLEEVDDEEFKLPQVQEASPSSPIIEEVDAT